MKKLVIIGATEFAEIAYEYFEESGEYKVEAFTVNSGYLRGKELKGLPVVPFENLTELYPPNEYYLFTAITYGKLNRVRENFYRIGKQKGYRFATYVSPHSFVWRNAEIGENSFIFEDNTIQYNVKIGKGVVLWSGNHIGHSAEIDDFCFVASHAVISGYCKVGKNSFIGVNATMGNNISLPDNSVLGAGAVMTHTFEEEGRTYVGNPARPIEKTSFECFGV